MCSSFKQYEKTLHSYRRTSEQYSSGHSQQPYQLYVKMCHAVANKWKSDNNVEILWHDPVFFFFSRVSRCDQEMNICMAVTSYEDTEVQTSVVSDGFEFFNLVCNLIIYQTGKGNRDILIMWPE